MNKTYFMSYHYKEKSNSHAHNELCRAQKILEDLWMDALDGPINGNHLVKLRDAINAIRKIKECTP